MTEAYISLRGEDAKRFEEFRDRLDNELPGGVDSNRKTVLAALDLADDALSAE
jgi:hypothetical protein